MIRIEDVMLAHVSLTEDPEFIANAAEAVNASMIPLKIVKNPHASLEVDRQRAPRDGLVLDHRAIIRHHIDDVIDRVIVVKKVLVKDFTHKKINIDFSNLFSKSIKGKFFTNHYKMLT